MLKQFSVVNPLRQLPVCLGGLGICVGSAYASFWLYKVFFVDTILSRIIPFNLLLIVPFGVISLLIYLLARALLLCSFLGILVIVMGVWEVGRPAAEVAKRAEYARLRRIAENNKGPQPSRPAFLVPMSTREFSKMKKTKTVVQYASELVAKKDAKMYRSNDNVQVFQVFYRKKQLYPNSPDDYWGEVQQALEMGLSKVVANEEPVKPMPDRLKKFLNIPQDQLQNLIVDDYVKVADVNAISAAEVIRKMQNNSDDLAQTIGLLGSDHSSFHLGDVIKTPTLKYLMFTEDGFRQVNLGDMPTRGEKTRQGFTHVVEYFIHLSTDTVVMEAYFKSKNEPTKEDIGNYINQLDVRDSTRRRFPVPTILSLPYQVINLRKEQ